MNELKSVPKKFRIWDINNNVFLQKVYKGRIPIYKDEKSELVGFTGGVTLDFAIDRPDLFVVQQFTGVCDVNNIEIYEGDYIELKYHTNDDPNPISAYVGLIKFGECHISYTSEAPQHGTIGFFIETSDKNEPQIGLYPDHNLCNGHSSIQIIGNYLQNQNLL